MMKQEKISEILGFSQPSINLVLTGKRPVSWPLAEKMAKIFPYRDVTGWKYATPEQFKAAFDEKKYGDLIFNFKIMKESGKDSRRHDHV